MKKHLKAMACITAATLMSVSAHAGLSQPAVVNVDMDNLFAGGDMISARGAKEDNVFIGCGTRNVEDGSGGLFSWAFCQAADADEEQVTCFTFNPDLVKTIREINDASYITFSWTDDGAGTLTCTRMGFSTQSFYLPKQKKPKKKKDD